MDDLLILINILKNNSIKQKELAVLLNITQQSISYKLKKLRKIGYIDEKNITEKGMEYLIQMHKTLSSALFKKNISLKGKVFSGIGEGGKFLKMKQYNEQIRKKLHFNIYPGTLNIRLDEEEAKKRASLPSLEFEYIKGFKEKNKIYGGIYIKKCYINGVEGAIILPIKSRYGFDTLELISKYYLRKKLNLEDGSIVEVVL